MTITKLFVIYRKALIEDRVPGQVQGVLSVGKRMPPKPTDGELAILRALWELGPCTVREVAAQLEGERKTGYTTILKLMQIMAEKGLVERDESARTHVYRAVVSKAGTQRQLVRHLLDRAFGGSAKQMVLQALSAKPAAPAELAEIRALLDRMEKGN